MELTPELLLEAKFGSARRGYDMAEVDDFLERCAEGLDVLLNRLRTEFERAERAESELVDVRRRLSSVDAGVADDTAAVADVPDAGPAPSAEAAEPAVGEPMRILIAAERTAEAAIADARAEAERIRSEAESVAGAQRSEAEVLLTRAKAEAEAEARRAGDEVKRAIQSEVVTLRRDRDALSDDIRILRRWLDDQRARMRTTARDLQRLAEDPGALRDVPVPETSAAPTGPAADEPATDEPGLDEPTDDASGDEHAAADRAGDDDVDVAAAADDEPGIDDGEPTEAVPAVDPSDDPRAAVARPFDDAAADDAPADSVR